MIEIVAGVEDDAVLSAGNAADVPQGGAYGGFVPGAAGEEVDVPGRPQLLSGPHAEERRALQGEAVHLVRGGEAVEEALDRVALEHGFEGGLYRRLDTARHHRVASILRHKMRVARHRAAR